jgi:hypothetical protein
MLQGKLSTLKIAVSNQGVSVGFVSLDVLGLSRVACSNFHDVIPCGIHQRQVVTNQGGFSGDPPDARKKRKQEGDDDREFS